MSHFDSFNDLKELGIECDSSSSSSDDSLTEQFNKAANYLPKILTKIDNETLLTLYGYYKQGSHGPCNSPKPSWYDFKAKSKWESWNSLGNMSQNEAKCRYIEIVNNIDPKFDDETKEGVGWVTVSTLLQNPIKESEKNIIDFIKEGNKDKLIKLLKNGYDVNKLDEDGLALIHWAADTGSPDILQIILDFGGNVNLQDSEYQTALHYAASCGHVECVELLLKHNADKEILDGDGLAPVAVTSDDAVKELLNN